MNAYADARSAFADMLNHEILTEEEIRDLIRRAQDGDRDARDEVVRHNVRFAWSFAVNYAPNDEHIPDLMQEAISVLFRCIPTFDLTGETRFVTYAGKAIENTLKKITGGFSDTIKVPNDLRRKISLLQKEFEDQNGRPPSTKELTVFAYETGKNDVVKALGAQRSKSLDSPFGGIEDGDSILDVYECFNDSGARDLESREFLEVLFKDADLTKLDKLLLIHRYGLFGEEVKSLSEVAEIIGSTKQRTVQLERVVMRKLKATIDLKKPE